MTNCLRSIRGYATIAISSVVLAATASPVSAQSDWRLHVQQQLQERGQGLRQQGFALMPEIPVGSLSEGEQKVLSFGLDGGGDYAFLGMCDSDCSDLDLRLDTVDGQEVDSDYQIDNTPAVYVENLGRSGTYLLTIGMAACVSGSCRYGVGVFRRR
jgi:hypothetical protein